MKDLFVRRKDIISFIFILLINLLFAYKYLSRYTNYALLISIIYISVLFLIFRFISIKKIFFIQTSTFFIISILAYSSIQLILFQLIDVRSLNVDRWSVINSFWKNVSKGEYPYLAVSHMGNHPGPLPVYFIITWPFLKLREIGLFSLLGFIILSIFLRRKNNRYDSGTAILILITSVALLWEILTRSTIFTNSVLFLISLFWFLTIDLKHKNHLIFSAIIAGLLLSTRTIFIIPLIIICIYYLKNKIVDFKTLLIWASLILLSLIIPFLPFIIFYLEDFIKLNPFTVQSEQLLPIYYYPLLILLAIYLGYISKNKQDIIFNSGMGFIITFAVYFSHTALKEGLSWSFFNSKADISYSLFSLPFFIYSYITTNNKEINQTL